MTLDMFSDGADWVNRDLIEALADNEVPTTFFVSGAWADANADFITYFDDVPFFDVQSHGTYYHEATSSTGHLACDQLGAITDNQQLYMSMRETTQSIMDKGVARPDLVVFPAGDDCTLQEDIDIASSLGMTVLGVAATPDAFVQDMDTVVQSALEIVDGYGQDGVILHLHGHGGINAPATDDALPSILDGLQSRGLDIVPIRELIRE